MADPKDIIIGVQAKRTNAPGVCGVTRLSSETTFEHWDVKNKTHLVYVNVSSPRIGRWQLKLFISEQLGQKNPSVSGMFKRALGGFEFDEKSLKDNNGVFEVVAGEKPWNDRNKDYGVGNER